MPNKIEKKIIKEFRKKWEDDTQCGGYIDELVDSLEQALAQQKTQLHKEYQKYIDAEGSIGWQLCERRIKKKLQALKEEVEGMNLFIPSDHKRLPHIWTKNKVDALTIHNEALSLVIKIIEKYE